MSENADLVVDTWRAFVRADPKAAFANLHDDVTWTVPGSMPGLSGCHRGKEGILAFLRAAARTFPDGLKTEIRAVHDAADVVVLELVNRGQTAAGRDYENEYCFVWELRDGKVAAIREYVDTARAAEIIFGEP